MVNAIFAATGQRIRALPIGKQTAMLIQQDGQVTRPRSEPAQQSTSNTTAPDATTKQTTGATDPPSKVKQMNDDANRKTQIEGK